MVLKKFKVFFQKKPNYFSENPLQILNVLRNFTIPVAFYGKFATIWWKKLSRSEMWTNIVEHERNSQTSGKKRTHLRGWFCSHIIYHGTIW